MILFCQCNHKFQDKEHGKGKRVFNKMAYKQGHPQEYRCSVCLTVKTQSNNSLKPTVKGGSPSRTTSPLA